MTRAAGGTTETLTAAVTAMVPGTVAFYNNGTTRVGTATVANGQAALPIELPAGVYSLTAVFTPTDSTDYAPQTSAAQAYTVNAAVTTMTSLTVSPATSASAGSSVTLTATVTPSTAVGTVQYTDSGSNIGSAALSGGTASLSTTGLAVGTHTITAVFTPTDSNAFAPSMSPAAGYVIAAPTVIPTPTPAPPALITPPGLSGTARVGTNETCTSGNWSGASSFTYVFEANGGVVQSGSNPVLMLSPGTYAKQLTCLVTASGPGGSNSAATGGVKVQQGVKVHDTKAPAITGKSRVGKTLSVKSGSWTPRANKFLYQWKLNGHNIKKATKSTLKLNMSEVGKHITCVVTAESTGYANGTATTKSVKVT